MLLQDDLLCLDDVLHRLGVFVGTGLLLLENAHHHLGKTDHGAGEIIDLGDGVVEEGGEDIDAEHEPSTTATSDAGAGAGDEAEAAGVEESRLAVEKPGRAAVGDEGGVRPEGRIVGRACDQLDRSDASSA